jgi:adenylate cyclase
VGYINIAPDGDGSVRAATLVQRYQNHYFPSADVQAVRAYLEVGAPVLHTAPEGITGIGLGSRFTSTDEIGRAYINYLGPEKTIATLSAVDVLKGRVSRDALQDKMVLIGATAKGIGDVRVTPFGAAFPGAEIRATIMENLLHDRFILRPAWAFAVELLLILSLGFALAFALPKLHVRTSALAVATLIALYLVLSIYLFQQRVWINLVYPVLLWSLLFVSSTVLKYLTTESEKRYIKSAFQYYVPSKVVEEIANDVTKLRLGGEKRELTVLFSDIRGFTTVSETLAPEALVRLLNAYLTKMTGCVFKFDGMLDKYIGDAIMAVYGAPVPHPDHAARACRTALDMMRELGDLQKFWRESGQPSFDIGIGINTGPMVVGNMGSDARFDYTVIGDAVNLGSRIEALNKTYGTHVLVSEFTYRLVKAEFPNAREIDLTPVRGRAKPVAIFELIPEGIYPHLGWLDDFSHAYQLYRADKVKQAVPIFEKLYAAVGDPVSLHFTRRGKNPRRRVADKH